MKVSFNGFCEKVLTFETDSEIEKGAPVKISANGKVAACEEDDAFVGFCTESDSEFAGVQLYGTVTAKYTGTAPELGYCALAAGDDGTVAAAEDGREYLVVAVDTTASAVTFIM